MVVERCPLHLRPFQVDCGAAHRALPPCKARRHVAQLHVAPPPVFKFDRRAACGGDRRFSKSWLRSAARCTSALFKLIAASRIAQFQVTQGSGVTSRSLAPRSSRLQGTSALQVDAAPRIAHLRPARLRRHVAQPGPLQFTVAGHIRPFKCSMVLHVSQPSLSSLSLLIAQCSAALHVSREHEMLI